LGSTDHATAGPTEAPEYQIKAAYLYNFAKFIQWPNEGAESSLNLCVIGENPFGDMLEKTVAGKAVRGLPLNVRGVSLDQEIDGCHLAFVPRSEADSIPRILDRISGTSVLTIGESEEFAKRGGVIELVEKGGSVRFLINRTAASNAHLTVSSQLLKLASGIVNTENR
jgi:hypothetical protein